MDDLSEEIAKRLEFAIRRDQEKGGDGFRTAKEIADACGISPHNARRLLVSLEEEGRVIYYQNGLWRLAPQQ